MPTVLEVDDVWDEPDVERVHSILRPINRGWWIAAGLAIDVFVGRKTREHHDADVAILGRGAEDFRRGLDSWEIGVAVGWTGIPGKSKRVLEMWKPEEPLPRNAEALWCRPSHSQNFVFELLINDARDDTWHFKRDHKITLPLARFGLKSSGGIPFVSPEVVLLHKATSTAFDEQDTDDFNAALPEMDDSQRLWLSESLSHFDPHHPWVKALWEAVKG